MGTNVAERKSVRHTISCPFFFLRSLPGAEQEEEEGEENGLKRAQPAFFEKGRWRLLAFSWPLSKPFGWKCTSERKIRWWRYKSGNRFFTLAALLIRSCSIKWKEICNEKGWWVKGLLVRVLSVSMRVARLRQHMYKKGRKDHPGSRKRNNTSGLVAHHHSSVLFYFRGRTRPTRVGNPYVLIPSILLLQNLPLVLYPSNYLQFSRF